LPVMLARDKWLPAVSGRAFLHTDDDDDGARTGICTRAQAIEHRKSKSKHDEGKERDKRRRRKEKNRIGDMIGSKVVVGGRKKTSYSLMVEEV